MIQKLSIFIGILFLFSACKEKTMIAEIETEFGTMKVELYNSTPLHRDNFAKLASEGFYDGLLFHRVMGGFMVQGGDPQSKGALPGARLGTGGPGYTITAEIGAPHFKGALAAARQPDSVNPNKESSGSQFYIVQGGPISSAQLDQFERMGNYKYNEVQRQKYIEKGGYPGLDNQYTVFGEVIEGLEVIDEIAKAETDPANRPLTDIPMKVRML